MEDTGTHYTVISEKILGETFKNYRLSNANTILKSYAHDSLYPLGQLENLNVTLNKQTRKLNCLVLPISGATTNRTTVVGSLRALWPLTYKTDNFGNSKIYKLESDKIRENLIAKFPDLYSNIPGCYNKGEIRIELKEGTKSIV